MRIKAATGVYSYSDVSIVSGEPRLEDSWKDTFHNPQVIMEILSPTTESYDRGDQFDHDQSISSLNEYVLVAQDRPQVVHNTRQPVGNDWNSTWLNGNAERKFGSLAFQIYRV
jgi:Uma2 family endonuclease